MQENKTQIKSETLDYWQKTLRCPRSHERLHFENDELVTESGVYRYPILPPMIPTFVGDDITEEAQIQREHYDRISQQYVENLNYAHTLAYMSYLDEALIAQMEDAVFENVAEICCGRGEAFVLFGEQIVNGLGLDISPAMLQVASKLLPDEKRYFIHGDAN